MSLTSPGPNKPSKMLSKPVTERGEESLALDRGFCEKTGVNTEIKHGFIIRRTGNFFLILQNCWHQAYQQLAASR